MATGICVGDILSHCVTCERSFQTRIEYKKMTYPSAAYNHRPRWWLLRVEGSTPMAGKNLEILVRCGWWSGGVAYQTSGSDF